MQSNSGHHPTPLFWYLGFHGNDILNFINTPKASTHYGGYSYKVSWSLMKGIQFFFKSPFFVSMATAAKFVQPIPIFFGLLMWMLFLSSFINFCLASNPLWSFLCFSFFLAFWPFPWQRQPCWKNQPLKAQLHMAYDNSTKFHKVWSRHLREMSWTNFWRKKERTRRITRIAIAKQ